MAPVTRWQGPASWALLFYYTFILLSTAASYGTAYPLFAWLLDSPASNLAVVLDTLVIIHIVFGIARRQRLTWYLMLGYNGFMLLSLMAGVALIPTEKLVALVGEDISHGDFLVGCTIAGAAMAVATGYAYRLKSAFDNPDPYLF